MACDHRPILNCGETTEEEETSSDQRRDDFMVRSLLDEKDVLMKEISGLERRDRIHHGLLMEAQDASVAWKKQYEALRQSHDNMKRLLLALVIILAGVIIVIIFSDL